MNRRHSPQTWRVRSSRLFALRMFLKESMLESEVHVVFRQHGTPYFLLLRWIMTCLTRLEACKTDRVDENLSRAGAQSRDHKNKDKE